jgi:hypothetical protein
LKQLIDGGQRVIIHATNCPFDGGMANMQFEQVRSDGSHAPAPPFEHRLARLRFAAILRPPSFRFLCQPQNDAALYLWTVLHVWDEKNGRFHVGDSCKSRQKKE